MGETMQACRDVGYKIQEMPMWPPIRDEFGVWNREALKYRINNMKSVDVTDRLCARGPTGENAKAELEKVIRGFCRDRDTCRPVGKISVEKYVGIWDKICRFLQKVGENSMRNPWAMKL